MAAQLDLFAAEQLNLLAALPVPVPSTDAPAMGPRRLTNMPPSVEAAWDRAWTVEVRQAFLDVAMAQPGEWVDGGRFYAAVARPHNIGCCWGHAMGAMARAGMLEVKKHYYGSERPGPDYKGYNNLYRWRPPMSEVARA